MRITEIKVNYLTKPTGITGNIQVGWLLESEERNAVQTAYQMQIALTPTFDSVVYNTGKVVNDESAHVEINKFVWESLTKYYLRVKVWDNNDIETDWQETSFFSAVQSVEELTGTFISAETKEDADHSKGTYLRNTFTLKKEVKSAYMISTALGIYEVYLNGKKVGNDQLKPGWTSYNKHLLYQSYDVSSLLQPGENAIGAMVGAGWYKGVMGFLHERNNYGAQTAFYTQLIVIYTDGSKEEFRSDSSWKGTDAPVVFAEIYDGETYDARLEQSGWNMIGFEENNDWYAVKLIDFAKENMVAQEGSTVKEMTKLPAQKIFVTPKGDTVVDFGQNLTGWVHVKVRGEKGSEVRLQHFETLDAEGNVYLDNLRKAKATYTYIAKDDQEVEVHPCFTFMGFRYIQIVDYPGTPIAEDFVAYAVHSEMEETGTFECSNPLVNQLQHNIKWSMKGNFLDIPSDCPQRDERVGWTGDAQIFCRTASYLMNTYTFYKKWLTDVAADQTAEGGVPHVVPDLLSNAKTNDDWLVSQGTHSAAAWGDVAIINPWTMYLTFGDKAILKKQYDSMKEWINFMRAHAVDGIWNYRLQFGDWVALDAEEGSYYGATPNDLTCTAFYAYSTGLFAKIAGILGREEDAKEYKELEQNIIEVFQSHFFDEEGNMTAQTQTAHIVALYFHLAPEKYKQQTIDGLLRLLEKENGHLVTGFVGTPYFCHALSENGHAKEAYELLLKEDFPSWLYQVKMGATTIWEHWDGLKPDGTMWSPDMNSFNHYAYGAVGEWLYRVCAGIEIKEDMPGYKCSVIHPHVGGFTYAKASYKSVYGVISSGWKKQNDEIQLDVTIPVNTTSEIILDDASEILEADGINFQKTKQRYTVTVGSGTYHIRYRKG